MSSQKCMKCGNEVPENSHFCNHCGSPLPKVVTCRHCGHNAPAGSKFCPACGQNLLPVSTINFDCPEPTLPHSEHPLDPTKHLPEDRGLNANGDANRVDTSKSNEEVDYFDSTPDDSNDDNEENTINDTDSKPTRSIAGPFFAALITTLILGIGGYFLYQQRFASAEEETEVTIDVPISDDEAANILGHTLHKENRLGDGSKVMFASQMEKNSRGEKQITGVTCNSQSQGASFYKVYTLACDSVTNLWAITNERTRRFEGKSISFDSHEVLGNGQSPCIAEVNGKKYLFFALAALPHQMSDNGVVSLALFSADTYELFTLNYEGRMVEKDGRFLVYGKTDNVNSAEAKYLDDIAANAALIYHPTPEELELERAENATRRWCAQNKANIDAINGGAESAHLNITIYDEPIFVAADTDNNPRIENDKLIVLTDSNGNVFGFSKTKRKYFVIYSPGTAGATSYVEFVNGTQVRITCANTDIVFDPTTCLCTKYTEESSISKLIKKVFQ